MAVNLSPIGGVAAQFFDNSGNILSGGKIYTYTAGTTTPQTTYTSASGATAHANPIILDAAGRVPSGEIWLTDGLQYKFLIKTSTDVQIGSYDNIIGINSNLVNYTNSQEFQTATAGQTVFTLTTMQYQPGINSLSVFVDGVNQYGPGALYAYQETSSTVVTFTAGLHVGADVKFTTAVINTSSYGDATQIAFTGFNGAVGTVADLADNNGADLVGFLQDGSGAVARSAQNKLRDVVSVKDFGAIGNGVDDDTAEIQAAINYVLPDGGTLVFPPGIYLHSSNLTFAKNQKTYLISGYGATLLPTSAVTTALEITGGGQRGQLVIEGLNFNHSSSTTITKAIDVLNSTYVKISRCTILPRDNVAYNAIKISASYWCTVEKCQFFGSGSPTYFGAAIWINGNSNATKLEKNQIANATYGVYIDPDVSNNTVNALRIVNNDFEGVTNAINIVNPAAPNYTTDGVLITLNRVEAATTFINIAGSLANESSQPPVSYNNYLVAGNVTNYIQNPNNQNMSIFEQTTFPEKFDNVVGGPGNFKIVTQDAGSNLTIGNWAGASSWQNGHIVLGSYHLWVNNSNGKLMINSSAPAAQDDGIVVGTQT